MRVRQHHIISRLNSRILPAGGALLMALLISGCSAVNMTGFSFPVFGLTKQSAAQSDGLTTSSFTSDENQAEKQRPSAANSDRMASQ